MILQLRTFPVMACGIRRDDYHKPPVIEYMLYIKGNIFLSDSNKHLLIHCKLRNDTLHTSFTEALLINSKMLLAESSHLAYYLDQKFCFNCLFCRNIINEVVTLYKESVLIYPIVTTVLIGVRIIVYFPRTHPYPPP